MSPIETLQHDELAAALGYLLATPGDGRRAPDSRVQGFLESLEGSRLRWEGLGCGSGTSASGLFLALLLPGSTAIVMIPTPGELGIDRDVQQRVTAVGLEHLRSRALHYAQALPAPEAHAQRLLLEQQGFRRLAPLVYLERDATYPWVDPPPAGEGAWIKFGEHTHEDFASTLPATYEDSLDCPELSGLRPVGDIIASHQASGPFDPGLWELLQVHGRIAACLLLARHAHAGALEVVYMGVVPSFRRRGIGSLLLRRALQRCREVGARRLTLVVDDRNKPGKRLYERFALRPVGRRDAYLLRW